MLHSSRFSRGNDASPPHSWLVEQVYTPKRERTTELVKRSIDALVEQKARISLASIAATSKKLDPEQQGISESAILGNQQARACYEQHRSWKGRTGKRAAAMASPARPPDPIKVNRDLAPVRQRYVRMSKAALVERLLTVEQLYAEQQERWLAQQDELLHWRLVAEAAETRLSRMLQEKAPQAKLHP